ncbi:hypothetical protein AcW1_007823 [Taiwanofungus camphoratus]|nr:hypothetical protein AcW1_007823 [Antrodia cinnamomea]
MTWGPDPLLTSLGITQAEAARSAWEFEVPFGIPTPEQCYASPLHRTLSTWDLTFNVDEILGENKRVIILENLREEHGVHTCDMRDSLSVIRRNFPPPTYTFEADFSEEDLIWQPDERETKEHVKERASAVLDKVFEDNRGTCTCLIWLAGSVCSVHIDVYFIFLIMPRLVDISVTAHGGIINGFLAAMGRTPYSLPTGGVLPLVIKRTTVF